MVFDQPRRPISIQVLCTVLYIAHDRKNSCLYPSIHLLLYIYIYVDASVLVSTIVPALPCPALPCPTLPPLSPLLNFYKSGLPGRLHIADSILSVRAYMYVYIYTNIYIHAISLSYPYHHHHHPHPHPTNGQFEQSGHVYTHPPHPTQRNETTPASIQRMNAGPNQGM